MEKLVFYGEETIYLNITKPTRDIVLHSVDLDLSEVVLKSSKFKYQISKLSQDPKTETVTFTSSKKIPKGKAELSLKFKGVLSDSLKGFYKSKYFHDGQEKFLATTQFEATDARRAFPCFDEPAQKAIFDVTLQIPKHMTAISNTIETDIAEHKGGYKVVKFAPSPKMSTYLLAFIVGEFEYIETKSKHGVVVRVFTTPGKKEQAQFALEAAAKVLDYYDDYFDIPYPLPILDLIAVPDFGSGAMENWGAITYRETALLVDPQNSSAANKQWVAIVIAHEIAHQWFGNLVTMEWWTDLWLNEGFASYMEYLGVNELFPEWRMWDQYVSERFAVALKLDALVTSHPIEIEVHHPDEIHESFDQISYAKGSVVIRMLAEYLGADVFRDGLRHYLKKHAYGNTTTKDLWASFEKVSKKPVRKIMEKWTRQTGYPLLSVKESNGKFELSQSRFFSSEMSRKKNKTKSIWPIPVSALDADGSKKQMLLEKSKAIIVSKNTGWVKFNHNETSLVRVAYNAEALDKLMFAVAENKLQPSDRLGVIRDAFALSETGQFSTVKALEFAGYYVNETDLPVWEEISGGVFSATEFYKDKPWYGRLEIHLQELFRPLAHRLTWEKTKGEGHIQGLLRSLALAQLGTAGDAATITKAQELFKGHIEGKLIPPDVRGVVYSLVAQNGGQKEFNEFIKLYKSSEQHHEEQDRVGRAMGNFKDKKVLAQVLDFAMSKNVRLQDSPSIFIGVGRNFYGRDLAWKFLQKNWKKINANYNVGGHLLEWFVAPFSCFSTLEKAKEYEQFFKKNPAPSVSRTIKQVAERIKSNAAYVKREEKNIEKWVKG